MGNFWSNSLTFRNGSIQYSDYFHQGEMIVYSDCKVIIGEEQFDYPYLLYEEPNYQCFDEEYGNIGNINAHSDRLSFSGYTMKIDFEELMQNHVIDQLTEEQCEAILEAFD